MWVAIKIDRAVDDPRRWLDEAELEDGGMHYDQNKQVYISEKMPAECAFHVAVIVEADQYGVPLLPCKTKMEFEFDGRCKQCSDNRPHPPHATAWFHTGGVTGCYYCPGVESDDLKIVIEKHNRGSPCSFSGIRGFWRRR